MVKLCWKFVETVLVISLTVLNISKKVVNDVIKLEVSTGVVAIIPCPT